MIIEIDGMYPNKVMQVTEIEQLEQAIKVLENQRASLGDAVVDAALGPLREKLLSLQPQTAEQRKMVTILFADLVGFTDLSSRLDPEDMRDILNRYFTQWTACIEARHGLVEKFIGDAVMAVFGLPNSQEDDPESAVLAALEMRADLEELNATFTAQYDIQLTMRVGIHTGQVVVSFLGERKGQDFVVVGEAVNLTSRLQSAAPENGILITHDTYRHVRGLFAVQPCPPLQVKGIPEPLVTYRVEYARERPFRMPTRGIEGIETPLVGRAVELEHLKAAYRTTIQDKKLQVVTVVGEAGIGKSRLLAEFDNWLQLQPEQLRFLKGRATPSMQYQPYSLLRNLFSYRFYVQDSDQPHIARQKFEAGFRQVYQPGSSLSEEDILHRAHWIARLLGFDFPANPYSAALDGQPGQQFFLQALAYLREFFLTLAAQGPVVALLEDLHWADDSSLDVVNQVFLGDRQDSRVGRIMVIGATRADLYERRPSWGKGKAFSSRLDLSPLSHSESHVLVASILQKVIDLPAALQELIVVNADGNPFYIEELVKMFIEDGIIRKGEEQWQIVTDRLESVHVPTTLSGVLQARLDSLGVEQRDLLQRASVIGRIFWDAAVNSLGKDQSGLGADELASRLEALQARELIFLQAETTFLDTREYQFKHILLRDVTYESLLKRERRLYHAHAAHWLEHVTQLSQRADEYAALIAGHYEFAGNRAAAASWYLRAGHAAAAQFANADAVRLLTRGLEFTPLDDQAVRYEALKAREYAYDLLGSRREQRQDLESLLALVESLGALELQAYVYLRWANLAGTIGQSDEARRYASQAVAFAQQTSDLALQAEALNQLGTTAWLVGDFSGARPHLEQALSISRAAGKPNLEAVALRQLGIVMEANGDYSAAHRYFEQAYEIMRRLKNRRGEGSTLNSLGIINHVMGDYPAAVEALTQALHIKQEIGDRQGQGITCHNLGLAAFALGDLMEGLGYGEKSLEISIEVEDTDGQGLSHAYLGMVATCLGDYPTARRHLEAALAIFQQTLDPQGLSDTLSYLSLLSSRMSEPQAALQYAQEALRLAEEVGVWISLVSAWSFLGQAYQGLGDYEKAIECYHTLLNLENAPQSSNSIYLAQAGLLLSYLKTGARPQVELLTQKLVLHLSSGDGAFGPLEGLVDPFLMYLAAFQGLKALDDSRAADLLRRGCQLLLQQAQKIPAGQPRRMFLENISSHRQLLAECDFAPGQKETSDEG